MMKVALIYFSPTENTKKIARVVKEAFLTLGEQVDEFDITTHSKRRETINLENYGSVIFGFPIYVHRAPEVIRTWIQTLNGKDKRCSIFFTYGGVTSGVAHFDTKKRLETQGFSVISTAEFLGKHTYNLAGWDLMENRPNEKDFNIAREYALKTQELFKSSEGTILEVEDPGPYEKKLKRLDKMITIGVKPPTREGQDCSLCMNCESDCPTNAMNAEIGEADGEKCIRCLRCLAFCPDNALKINDMTAAYAVIIKSEGSPEELASKESKYFI